jgi:hypothetical protein
MRITPDGRILSMNGPALSGAFTMWSWIDLEAKQMLKCSSSGAFDMTMRFSGLPAEAQNPPGTLSFKGTFSQELTRL